MEKKKEIRNKSYTGNAYLVKADGSRNG